MSTAGNAVRRFRQRRGWAQQELARRAGISRAAVSAIEQHRLAPSVTAAMSLAAALDCTVEQLFGRAAQEEKTAQLAWPSTTSDHRCWQARVAGHSWLYPVEPTAIGEVPHDNLAERKTAPNATHHYGGSVDQVLVVATCDPAIGLLADLYARQTPFRLLPLTRSSRTALDLMGQGKVHAAGVHLASIRRGNAPAVRALQGTGHRLLRVANWQEGIAFAPRVRLRSRRAAASARLKWVFREPGSGARQCLDELLGKRTDAGRLAPDHRAVALAVRCGWADAGVCLQLAGVQAGLDFFPLRREPYDLCFPAELERDPKMSALVDVVRSPRFRTLLGQLPGYCTRSTGEISQC